MNRSGKNTSFDQRQLVIFHFAKGKTNREISELLNIPKSTVGDIIRRYKNEDRIDSVPQNGRPKILSQNDERYIMKKVKIDPRISAPKLKTDLESNLGICVSSETVRRVIRKNGLNGRIARKKPFISEVNKKKRIEFAKKYKKEDQTFWNNVLFTDESKFNLFGSDGRVNVWRRPNEELKQKNLRATVKHGGGSVMVWGCFSAAGVGSLVFIDGIMDRKVYINILRNNMKQSAEKLGIKDKFNFYQDNDPKHKANETRLYLLYNCPKVLETPPQSPDLNPIENLWEQLDARVRKHTITNKNQLKEVLIQEWNGIEAEVTQKLVNSMPNRLKMVLENKGYPTKY